MAASGRARKLTSAQRQRLEKHLLKGARAAGFPTDLWTCPRVAEHIERTFGVRYHVDHVCRLLHAMSWSPQKPTRRAVERDEEASASGSSRCGRPLKKSKLAEGLAGVSGRKRLFACPSWCGAVGHPGQTPVLLSSVALTTTKVSAIAALCVSPQRDQVRLYFRLYPGRDVDPPRAIRF